MSSRLKPFWARRLVCNTTWGGSPQFCLVGYNCCLHLFSGHVFGDRLWGVLWWCWYRSDLRCRTAFLLRNPIVAWTSGFTASFSPCLSTSIIWWEWWSPWFPRWSPTVSFSSFIWPLPFPEVGWDRISHVKILGPDSGPKSFGTGFRSQKLLLHFITQKDYTFVFDASFILKNCSWLQL